MSSRIFVAKYPDIFNSFSPKCHKTQLEVYVKTLEDFWGKAPVKMASKTAKKTTNTTASTADKARDCVTEMTETELSPALTKAMVTITANISGVIEAKFDSFLQKILDILKVLQDTNKR